MEYGIFHDVTEGSRHLRRLEDVEYWRQRAGWFNDDESMKEFNEGVTNNDATKKEDNAIDGKSRGTQMAKNAVKVACIVVALGLSILMFRAIMRRMSANATPNVTSVKRDKKRSESKARSRSSSIRRTRSRSRSRLGEYDLMPDDDGDTKSKKSSRSKSSTSTRRSRSRSRHDLKRSGSRGRTGVEKKPIEPVPVPVPVHKETVLV